MRLKLFGPVGFELNSSHNENILRGQNGDYFLSSRIHSFLTTLTLQLLGGTMDYWQTSVTLLKQGLIGLKTIALGLNLSSFYHCYKNVIHSSVAITTKKMRIGSKLITCGMKCLWVTFRRPISPIVLCPHTFSRRICLHEKGV